MTKPKNTPPEVFAVTFRNVDDGWCDDLPPRLFAKREDAVKCLKISSFKPPRGPGNWHKVNDWGHTIEANISKLTIE